MDKAKPFGDTSMEAIRARGPRSVNEACWLATVDARDAQIAALQAKFTISSDLSLCDADTLAPLLSDHRRLPTQDGAGVLPTISAMAATAVRALAERDLAQAEAKRYRAALESLKALFDNEVDPASFANGVVTDSGVDEGEVAAMTILEQAHTALSEGGDDA